MHHHRIALIEDHLLQRRFAEKLLTGQPDMRVVFSGETLPDFMTWLGKSSPGSRPHLIVLDLLVDHQPSADPNTVRQLVRDGYLVVVLSALSSPPLVRRMILAGVNGIIGKRDSESTVVDALRRILAGEVWMTPELATVTARGAQRPTLSDQEERALILYASGCSIETVARSIGVQKNTAKKYIQRVREKYAALGRPSRNRIELHRAAAEDGYLDIPVPIVTPES
ncbi:response regulator transcription factor [Cumulibacter soli]|uniref:response regulator transcription factor n=1 Tax=Cumulibacter soli TaxID=2546344 RepID=UPI001067B1D3|nr:response regulator transcription factor [Cumulibacter soli]